MRHFSDVKSGGMNKRKCSGPWKSSEKESSNREEVKVAETRCLYSSAVDRNECDDECRVRLSDSATHSYTIELSCWLSSLRMPINKSKESRRKN